MKKTNFLVVFLVGFTFLAKAQNYKTAAGVRLGPNTAAISGGLLQSIL